MGKEGRKETNVNVGQMTREDAKRENMIRAPESSGSVVRCCCKIISERREFTIPHWIVVSFIAN